MEQFARRPFTRRHHFPQHTAFLLREGNAKFGHGKSPSPQTTLRSEKKNRPGATCQSKIAKLLAFPAFIELHQDAIRVAEEDCTDVPMRIAKRIGWPTGLGPMG